MDSDPTKTLATKKRSFRDEIQPDAIGINFSTPKQRIVPVELLENEAVKEAIKEAQNKKIEANVYHKDCLKS